MTMPLRLLHNMTMLTSGEKSIRVESSGSGLTVVAGASMGGANTGKSCVAGASHVKKTPQKTEK